MRLALAATLLAAVLDLRLAAPLAGQQRAATDTAAKSDELPLKPTRTVEFTTSEGTWISLDVSPDGQTIVFELLGDLYTLPVAGGETHHLRPGVRHAAALLA